MSLPTIIGAYNDCFDQFEKALNAKNGIRVLFQNFGEAKMFQARMQQARALQRQESRRMYDRESPLFDRSEYDPLIVRSPVRAQEEDHWWVYVQPARSVIIDVEELDGD